jgi:hypothetical protein
MVHHDAVRMVHPVQAGDASFAVLHCIGVGVSRQHAKPRYVKPGVRLMRRMLCLFSALAVAVPAPLASVPARADRSCSAGSVTIPQAIEIAREAGLVRVKKVECDDGLWEVEGWTEAGREIEVEIDPRTGRIVKVERD